jgi:uncharacterized membrane protein YeaQ/YmgE (transglycosylase-associated protein family)
MQVGQLAHVGPLGLGQLADLTVHFTLNDVLLFIIAGAIGGLVTGQLMRSAGWMLFGDLFFGGVGGLVAVYLIGGLLHFSQYGFAAQLLLALAGGVLALVLAHLVLAVRRRAKATM